MLRKKDDAPAMPDMGGMGGMVAWAAWVVWAEWECKYHFFYSTSRTNTYLKLALRKFSEGFIK